MMPTLIPSSPLSLPPPVSLPLRLSRMLLVVVAAADAGLAVLRFVASGVFGGDAGPVESAGVACAVVSVVAGVDSRTTVAVADMASVFAAVVAVAAAYRSEQHTEPILCYSHVNTGAPPFSAVCIDR